MHDWESLAHVRWECKYHVVIIPSIAGKCCTASFGPKSGRFCGSCAANVASSCWKDRRNLRLVKVISTSSNA